MCCTSAGKDVAEASKKGGKPKSSGRYFPIAACQVRPIVQACSTHAWAGAANGVVGPCGFGYVCLSVFSWGYASAAAQRLHINLDIGLGRFQRRGILYTKGGLVPHVVLLGGSTLVTGAHPCMPAMPMLVHTLRVVLTRHAHMLTCPCLFAEIQCSREEL